MTAYTNRKGATDYYDESVAETVKKNVDQYIRIYHRMPSSVGVDHVQLAELKKAEEAGVALVAVCKGRTERISYLCAEGYYRPRNVPNREENKALR